MSSPSKEALRKRSSGPRKTAKFPELLHHQLNMYALAASAAGVGMLFNPTTAEGKIVYTPANVALRNGTSFPLDLDHNGIVDFYLVRREIRQSMSALQSSLSVCHVAGTSLQQF